MATQKLNLTRDQLATFLKNHEQIKQFENLFAVANQVPPASDTQGISIQAGNADAAATEALAQIVRLAQDAATNSGAADQKAVQALDTLGRIANALEMLATAPVIQNNNSVVTDYIDLPENGPHVTQARRVQWNRDDGTVDIGLYGGSVLQVGQELMFYAKNTSGSLIPNGTPVMFTGTVGSSGKLTFGLAIANGSVPADYMMGVTTQDVANNAFGYVITFGLVRGFNTTGAPYGETWNDGDLLYFGAAAPGTWTKVQPIAPRIDVPVAVVVNAGSGGSGSIFVRMTVAESLARLQDVFISGLANDDVLVYDSADQRWENRTQSSLVVGRADNLSGGLAGSLPYQTAPNTTAMLGIGAANRVLTSNGSAPAWSDSLNLDGSLSVKGSTTIGDASSDTALFNAVIIQNNTTGYAADFRSNGSATGADVYMRLKTDATAGDADAQLFLDAGGTGEAGVALYSNGVLKSFWQVANGEDKVEIVNFTYQNYFQLIGPTDGTTRNDPQSLRYATGTGTGPVVGITGTIDSTAALSTVSGLSTTTGLVVGMQVVKTAGTGAFGVAAVIRSIDSATQITVESFNTQTAGSITFNAVPTPVTFHAFSTSFGTWGVGTEFAQFAFGNADGSGAGDGGIKAKIAAYVANTDGAQTGLKVYTASSGTTLVEAIDVQQDQKVRFANTINPTQGIQSQYDSGWVAATNNSNQSFTHNLGTSLGVTAEEMVVTIWIKDGSGRIFQCPTGYGASTTNETDITIWHQTNDVLQLGFGHDGIYAYDNTTLGSTVTLVVSGEVRVKIMVLK